MVSTILLCGKRHSVVKEGKGPADVETCRPIVLTSMIGKLLECMIANRLSWWLQEQELLILSPWQAGI